jgi:hypothetical protein
MSFLQHRPDSTSQVIRMHPIEFRLTQSTKQLVNRLVVGVEHVPRSWSEEVHQLDRTCVRTMCGSRTSGWSLPCVMSD